MGKMIQYKYLLRYLQTNDEAFANNTKLSIYSAVLDGVTTKTCSYVKFFSHHTIIVMLD